ncbi:hypothetical protein HMPREF1981_00917 [Bacteroides pyogenes F0041]|uniref:Uncharacterized protein n=1 Tax=Bacteroides pyogenes F0041 TaxID=1321819 RepID=U2DXK7_9BACE|nr:hypothetical protein HMPREF1981_00917 [Bacteroides pyogenes F0041]
MTIGREDWANVFVNVYDLAKASCVKQTAQLQRMYTLWKRLLTTKSKDSAMTGDILQRMYMLWKQLSTIM